MTAFVMLPGFDAAFELPYPGACVGSSPATPPAVADGPTQVHMQPSARGVRSVHAFSGSQGEGSG